MTAITSPIDTALVATLVSERLKKKAFRHINERVIEFIMFCAAAFSVFVTAAIVFILLKESWVFFQTVSIWDFLTDHQ